MFILHNKAATDNPRAERPAVPQVGGGCVRWEHFQSVRDSQLKEGRPEGVRGGADRRWQGLFGRHGTYLPHDGQRLGAGRSRGAARGRIGAASQGARASCLYHGALTSAARLRRSSSARPSSVPILFRNGVLTLRCQKHPSSTYARNKVSTKFTIAKGACLKQWSSPQSIDSVLKQSFSSPQR